METILQLASVTASPWALGAVVEEGGTNQSVHPDNGQGGCHTVPRPHWC